MVETLSQDRTDFPKGWEDRIYNYRQDRIVVSQGLDGLKVRVSEDELHFRGRGMVGPYSLDRMLVPYCLEGMVVSLFREDRIYNKFRDNRMASLLEDRIWPPAVRLYKGWLSLSL